MVRNVETTITLATTIATGVLMEPASSSSKCSRAPYLQPREQHITFMDALSSESMTPSRDGESGSGGPPRPGGRRRPPGASGRAPTGGPLPGGAAAGGALQHGTPRAVP